MFPDLLSWVSFDFDWRYFAFVSVAIALCALLAGLIPAHHVLRRLDVRAVIGANAGQVTKSADRLVSLRALVVSEVALALVLLARDGLVGASFCPASACTLLPFSGQHVGNFFEPEGGAPRDPRAKRPVVLTRACLPDYFATMAIAVLSGRAFSGRDRDDVVIVNETMARLFWPGENPIGKWITSQGRNPREVMGVVRDGVVGEKVVPKPRTRTLGMGVQIFALGQ